MDRVLLNSELLSSILKSADGEDQARCTRVSKYWFEIAVPIVWHSLDELGIIFKLFPLNRKAPHPAYKLDMDSDWARFNRYAPHVRTIELTPVSLNNAKISSAMQEIAHTRIIKCLLPNLVKLVVWRRSNILSTLFFIHEDLRRISLSIDTFEDSILLCNYALPKALGLTYLCIRYKDTVFLRELEKDLCSALRNLASLEDLVMDNLCLTSALLSSVVALPKLKKFQYSMDNGPLDERNTFAFREDDVVEHVKGFFSNLEEVIFHLNEEVVNEFIYLDALYSGMKEFDVDFTGHTGTDSLKRLCSTLATKMCHLTNLSLDLKTYTEIDRVHENERLIFQDFLVLSSLHQLQNFSFKHPASVRVLNCDIKELIQNWSDSVSFELETKHDTRNVPETTLSIIKVFAEKCPKLEELSIPMNAEDFTDLPVCSIILRNLKQLHFGPAPIKKPGMGHICVYLSQFCTSSCQLLVNSESFFSTDEGLQKYRPYWAKLARDFSFMLEAVERARKNAQLEVAKVHG